MRYLCLIWTESSAEPSGGEEALALYREYVGVTEDLQRSGRLIAANRLRPASEATTVRVRTGRLTITDGPFAETKEQIGGYYLIDAIDMNDAVQIAKRIPGARYGCIELRAVVDDTTPRMSSDADTHAVTG
jgi:hypothetical protein